MREPAGDDVKPMAGLPLAVLLARAGEAVAAGRAERAEALFRAALAHRQAPVRVALALPRLAAARQDWAQAAADWRACLNRFPQLAAPSWLMGLREALSKAGDAQASAVEDELIARFPETLAAEAILARRAAVAEDWAAALTFYQSCLELEPDTERIDLRLGHAQALLRLWRHEEALAVYDDVVSLARGKERDEAQALLARAWAAEELGQAPQAEADAAALIANHPGAANPDCYGLLCRALLERGAFAQAGAVREALAGHFPLSPVYAQLLLAEAHRRYLGLQEFSALLDQGLARFPAERALRAEHVRVLLGRGAAAEAAQLAAALAVEAEDHHALIARWLVRLDREGIAALAASAPAEALSQPWVRWQAVTIAENLLRFWTPWAAELALRVLEEAEARWPGRPALRCKRALCLIRLQRNEEAAALIAALPAPCQSRDAQELRAWAATQDGRHEQAKAIWQGILASAYIPSQHAPAPRLTPVRLPDIALGEHEATLILVVRNELSLLPAFFAHYRALGLRRCIVIDNMSSDGTFEYLAAQPDVLLYRTADDYRSASSGMRWRQEVIARHVPAGWCLSIDADEHLIYPGIETIQPSRLIAYLAGRGADGLAGYMLDVYPVRLFMPDGAPAPGEDHVYYDKDYHWFGNVRAPYRQPAGGARARLFGVMEYLHKVPLFHSARVRVLDSHETTPLRLADVSGALLHYKLRALAVAEALESGGEGVRATARNRAPDVMRRYQRYATLLAGLRGQDLRVAGVSARLTDSWAPVADGLMRAGPDYRGFVQTLAHG